MKFFFFENHRTLNKKREQNVSIGDIFEVLGCFCPDIS